MGGKIQIQISLLSYYKTLVHNTRKKGITQVCSQGSKFDDNKTIEKGCPLVRHSLKKEYMSLRLMANGRENSNSNFFPLYWETFNKKIYSFLV